MNAREKSQDRGSSPLLLLLLLLLKMQRPGDAGTASDQGSGPRYIRRMEGKEAGKLGMEGAEDGRANAAATAAAAA